MVQQSNSLLNQHVRVYRLYTQIDNQDVRRMQICTQDQLFIDDSCIGSARGPFQLNVWPARFALFEATGGEMVRVPQEEARLEMPAPSYWSLD